MNKYNFYDTSSLIMRANNLFDDSEEKIVISSITLSELEHIKNATNKDADIKFAARRILSLLTQNPTKYEIHIFKEYMLEVIRLLNLPIENDTKILACAIDYDKNVHPDDTTFITNDLALYHMANLYFGADSIYQIEEDDDDYFGYKEVFLNEKEKEYFYSNPYENIFNLNVNEYLLIFDDEVKNLKPDSRCPIDIRCWTGEEYRSLNYGTFSSNHFGDIKPMRGDAYQACAADSLMNNTITMVKGGGGTGKTILALGYLMSLLERDRISKIIVFCNTVATKNSVKLGFLPGTRDEKLLDSQIGNLLISKLGGRIEVERLIEAEKLLLLPMSDIRGYDTSGMNAGIYISEAQNLDIELMRLVLQRIGNDSICIIDGDEKTQVDDVSFAGACNGMKRASKVFRGENIYGEIRLQIVHRSKIAKIAEKM